MHIPQLTSPYRPVYKLHHFSASLYPQPQLLPLNTVCVAATKEKGMAFNGGLLILLMGSLFAVSFANTTVVGGNENWHFGFNYTNWAFQNSPFYLDDTLG